jgi:pre-mRNA-splicing helicase BRR2
MGIGYIHDGMSEKEKDYVKTLYKKGIIKLLIVIYSLSWSINDLESHIVVILDAERFDGHEHRSVEYSIPDMLQMMSRANTTSKTSGGSASAKCILFCHTPKKEYFIKFLQEPLPIESSLDHSLHDHLNADVVAGTIENKQDAVDWITWTFMYRRIA